MQVLQATIGQMLVLFSLILLGFLLYKLKAIPENSSVVLSKLENDLLMPALVLGTFAEHFRMEKLSTAWQLFVVSFLICFVMMALAVLISKFCTKDQYLRKNYTFGLVFSNFGFMGNAVVSAAFPELFFEYLIFTIPMWTMACVWGIPCLLIPAQEGKQTIKSRLKAFVNPIFMAMLLGLILGLTNAPLPTFATKVIDVTGDCMSPVAMILTGITIAQMDMKKVLSMPIVYGISLLRLVAFPLLCLGLLAVVAVPRILAVCAVCVLAMPFSLSAVVIPGGYGKDTSVAAGITLVTHLLSAITIPCVFYLLMCML